MIAGFVKNAVISLLIGIVLMVAVLLLIKSITARKTVPAAE